MSDRPNDNKPDEPENRAGRKTPDSPGGWRVPNQTASPGERHAWRSPSGSQTDAQDQPEGWRVPTLPRDLDVAPGDRGAWHLPQPDDTRYSPDDESVIAPESETEISPESTSEVEVPASADASGEEAVQEPVQEPAQASAEKGSETAEIATSAQEILPFEGDADSATSDASTQLEPLDEDEDDSFSMSELVALASLVDNVPSVEVRPAVSTSEVSAVSVAGEGEAAGTDDQPLDPAEYARQQLARLQQPQEASAEASGRAATPEEGQAEAYARQQLAQLGIAAQPAQTPAPTPVPLTEAPSVQQPDQAASQPVSAETNKFRQAEDKIRSLRQQYQQGSITRDQFQADLRQSMVLDDDNVWWMMGVESDLWYKHDNGTWVPATPPGLEQGSGAVSAVAPAPQVNDLGDEGDRTVPTTPIQEWVPRAVPVRDPDYTVPGTGGLFLNNDNTVATVPIDSEATVLSSPINENTLINPALQDQYESVAGAIPASADQPPDYEIEEASVTYEDAVARQRSRLVRTVAVIAAVLAALLFLLGAVAAIGIVLYYNNLADPWRGSIAGLASYQPQFRTARILAADNSLIAQLTSPQGGARDEVALSAISPEMIAAVVSIENERYFEDPGFDPVAIGRAFLQNVSSGSVVSGASTITQEVARNLILQDTTVSPERKLQEIVIAAEIARSYDKNFILQLYLNEVFFGNQSYGIEAASQFYFGHGADSLNLAEAAMLAGLIQAPARYDPVINRQAAFDRMDTVLQQMADVGCLQFTFAPYNQQPFCVTQADINSPRVVLQKAQVETRNYSPRTFTVKYPHFVNFVQQQIEISFGTSEMYRRGFEIKTTLIPRIQEVAQDALAQQVNALSVNGVNTGAVMVTDPRDGSIRAMVGSPDFSDDSIDGQVNNAFTWQQPGSSIKIIEYTAALEGVDRNGTRDYYTPATILWDVPTSFQNPSYTPLNFDRAFHGPVALRYALANSYNVPAVKTLNFIGVDKFLDTAQRMGLRFLPEAQFGLATSLGANEVRLYDMMQAYGTLANNGTRVAEYSITSITDGDGNAVTLPERAQPALAVQPQVAFLLQSILSDNAARTPAFGGSSPLNVNGYDGRVAAKTGTSNDNRDLWTMGFSSNIVVGVWIGRVDNNPTTNTSGLAAAPIWNAVMSAALQGTTPQPFTPPQGIIQQQVCADTGTVYDASVPCSGVRSEYFVQNSPPPSSGQGFVVTVPVDTWTGLRANQFCTESVVTQTFVNITDPSAVAWLNTAAGQAYAASVGVPTPIRTIPSEECTPSTVLPQVRLSNPTTGAQVSGAVQISGVAQGPNFARYQVELAPASSPENFQPIAGPFNNQANGTLATWDSTNVPNGAYKMRLAAFAADGGYRYDTIDIGVNNIIPTEPPPTLPPIIVPTDNFIATPIPFGTAIPFTVPTPTIFLGG